MTWLSLYIFCSDSYDKILYGIKIGVSIIFVALKIVRKYKKFDDIADTNTNVKRITHTFIQQIAKEIKKQKVIWIDNCKTIPMNTLWTYNENKYLKTSAKIRLTHDTLFLSNYRVKKCFL